MKGINIQIGLGTIEPEQVLALYRAVEWGEQASSFVQGIRASSFVAVATNAQEELVGLVRALTDGVTVVWIPELVIHPEYQRRGIGTQLLTMVMVHYSEMAIYAEMLHDRIPFAAKCGLVYRPHFAVVSKAPL